MTRSCVLKVYMKEGPDMLLSGFVQMNVQKGRFRKREQIVGRAALEKDSRP